MSEVETSVLLDGRGQEPSTRPSQMGGWKVWKPENNRLVRKIAVLRAHRLGDFIFALPAIEALRRTYPQAEIVLLGREWHAEILEGRTGPIDRVIVIPPVHGIYMPGEAEEDAFTTESFFSAMEREQFDLAIQVHGDGRFSNPFVQRLGARVTVGSKDAEAQPLDLWVPYSADQPEILRHLEVVSLVGAHASVLEPHLDQRLSDLEAARSFLPVEKKPVVALYPGGENLRQRWPTRKFAEVGDALAMAGASVAIVGAEEERRLADELSQEMSQFAQNLAGKMPLRAMVGFLSQCRLLIGNNSDLLRLAWAVSTPTVGIFWYGSLVSTGPLNRLHHRPAVSWRTTCPDCGANLLTTNCGHPASYLDDVTTMEVLSSALDLLTLAPWGK